MVWALPSTDAPSGGLPPEPRRDSSGPPVRLARSHRFTDTEWARVAELRRGAAALATPPCGEEPSPRAVTSHNLRDTQRLSAVSLREGSLADLDAVRLMHARCSSETLRRRYHSTFGFLTPRLARAVLEPSEGFSLLLCAQDRGRDCVIGMGLVVVREAVAEAALMVEDRWQGHGFGSRILQHLVVGAGDSGISELTLLAQPSNQIALARTIARAGLVSRRDDVDGFTRFRTSVRHLVAPQRKGGQPAIGTITAPLATLLHRRRELRDAVAAADLIDAAIRDGA